jgi:hypothetical protein
MIFRRRPDADSIHDSGIGSVIADFLDDLVLATLSVTLGEEIFGNDIMC